MEGPRNFSIVESSRQRLPPGSSSHIAGRSRIRDVKFPPGPRERSSCDAQAPACLLHVEESCRTPSKDFGGDRGRTDSCKISRHTNEFELGFHARSKWEAPRTAAGKGPHGPDKMCFRVPDGTRRPILSTQRMARPNAANRESKPAARARIPRSWHSPSRPKTPATSDATNDAKRAGSDPLSPNIHAAHTAAS